jgi:hypothetical protein
VVILPQKHDGGKILADIKVPPTKLEAKGESKIEFLALVVY